MIGKPVSYKSVDEGTTFTINDRQYESLMVAPYYFICLESVDGYYGADISAESHPIPNLIGEKSGDYFRRGKTLTLTGTIYGRGLAELYEGADYLKHMFAQISGLRKLLFTPWNSPQLYVKCRVTQDLSVNMQITSSFKWPYTVGLRCDDPRTYKTDGTLFPTWQE